MESLFERSTRYPSGDVKLVDRYIGLICACCVHHLGMSSQGETFYVIYRYGKVNVLEMFL